MTKPEPWYGILIFPILISFLLGLIAARGSDLGLDGGLSLAITRIPFIDQIDFLAHDVHPPLYYIFLRGWVHFLGTSPLVVKLLSAFAATLGVAALVGWTISVSGQRSALIAGLAFAVAPVAVEMSATAREFAVSLPFVIFVAWAGGIESRRSQWLSFIAATLAIWTCYLSAAVLVAVGCRFILVPRQRRRLLPLVAAGTTILPWMAYITMHDFLTTVSSSGPRQGIAAPDPLLTQLWDVTRLVVTGRFVTPDWLGPAVAAVTLAAMVAVWRAKRPTTSPRLSSDLSTSAVAAAITVGIAIAVNTTWTREGMGTRYLLMAVPFLAMLLGSAAAGATRNRVGSLLLAGPVIVAAGLGTAAWLQRPAAPAEFWSPKQTVAWLDQQVAPNDAIVFGSPEQAGYYAALSAAPRRWSLVPVSPDYLAGDAVTRIIRGLPILAVERRTVWFVNYHQFAGVEGTAKIGDWLSANAYPLPTVKLRDSDIEPYLAAPENNVPPRKVEARFAGGVVLESARFPDSVRRGDSLPLELTWTASETQPRNLSVFVHLTDLAERKLAQHDSIPANGRAPMVQWRPGQEYADRHGLLIPANAPTGDYLLTVGLYDGAGRLALATGGDSVRLSPISVRP